VHHLLRITISNDHVGLDLEWLLLLLLPFAVAVVSIYDFVVQMAFVEYSTSSRDFGCGQNSKYYLSKTKTDSELAQSLMG
jgi:hypothetical protein